MKSEEKALGVNLDLQKTGESYNGLLGNEDKQDSNSNVLIERIEIPSTPFMAVRKEKDWYVMLGNYRLTPELESFHDASKEALLITWNKIMNVMAIMVEELKNEK